MYYFTSDVHFNNEDTLKNDNRPFKTTKEYDTRIIRSWNKTVNKDDVIYVIGDLVDCDGENDDNWKKSIKYVSKIKCNVVLIMGNNEDRIVKYYFDNDLERFREYCKNLGFKEVYKDLIIEFKGMKFNLTHKPINCREDVLNLFGHIHRAGGIYSPLGFNIGCDLNHFQLYSEDDIDHLLYMKNNYWDKDKNLNKNTFNKSV